MEYIPHLSGNELVKARHRRFTTLPPYFITPATIPGAITGPAPWYIDYATACEPDESWFDTWQEVKRTQRPIQWLPGAASLVVKFLGHEVEHSLLYDGYGSLFRA